jgi:hypothetical protein
MAVALVVDPHYGPSRCRGCGGSIVWALTDGGRRMPVDAQAVAGGELELFEEYFPDGEPVDPGVQRVRNRPADRPPSSPAWRCHWITCSARRGPRRIPRDVIEFIANALRRKWGPLFATRGGGRA